MKHQAGCPLLLWKGSCHHEVSSHCWGAHSLPPPLEVKFSLHLGKWKQLGVEVCLANPDSSMSYGDCFICKQLVRFFWTFGTQIDFFSFLILGPWQDPLISQHTATVHHLSGRVWKAEIDSLHTDTCNTQLFALIILEVHQHEMRKHPINIRHYTYLLLPLALYLNAYVFNCWTAYAEYRIILLRTQPFSFKLKQEN